MWIASRRKRQAFVGRKTMFVLKFLTVAEPTVATTIAHPSRCASALVLKESYMDSGSAWRERSAHFFKQTKMHFDDVAVLSLVDDKKPS